MAHSSFYNPNSASSHFPFASTSKALPFYQWQQPLPWSNFNESHVVTYPFEDCLPISPESHFRSKHPSFTSQSFGYAQPSDLDSYRFPHGLPTPESSRPSSPSTASSKPISSHEDFPLEDHILLDPLTLEEDSTVDEDEEDEDEELFRRRMMMERREHDFDGDMEDWKWTTTGETDGGDWREREDWSDTMEE
ncbi:hypothetical protein JCM5353_000777 [Sporobolomyces roseus]